MEDKYAAQPEQEIAPKTPDADDVDALLQDVKSLLGESDGETAEQPPPEDEPVPEGPGGVPACTARGIRAHPGAGAACKSRAPAGI